MKFECNYRTSKDLAVFKGLQVSAHIAKSESDPKLYANFKFCEGKKS